MPDILDFGFSRGLSSFVHTCLPFTIPSYLRPPYLSREKVDCGRFVSGVIHLVLETRLPPESTFKLDSVIDVLTSAITYASTTTAILARRRIFSLLRADILRANSLQRKLRSALDEFCDEEWHGSVGSLSVEDDATAGAFRFWALTE